MLLDRIKEKGEDLAMLDRHDRLQYLVDMAKDVEPLADEHKTEENRIHGCASKLWITSKRDVDGIMWYRTDGDAFITKGTAKLVTDLVNGSHTSEIAHLEVKHFEPLGIKELMTMQRQNGLGELITRIIRIANES